MALDNKTVFLAGASGMTGTSILRRILDQHPKTRVRASVLNTEPALESERVTYVRGDLRNLEECRKMAAGCDCAIMAAAYAGGGRLHDALTF